MLGMGLTMKVGSKAVDTSHVTNFQHLYTREVQGVTGSLGTAQQALHNFLGLSDLPLKEARA
eukprot:scaffold102540_cov17-Tisochrysis_lutea.AAC.1